MIRETQRPTDAKKKQVLSGRSDNSCSKQGSKKKRSLMTIRGCDGRLLRKGEVVYGVKDRRPWTIEGFYKSNPWSVRTTTGIQLKPSWLTHTPKEEFAVQRARGARLALGMSRAKKNLDALSEETGIPRKVLSGWTQFFWCRNIQDVIKICTALNISAVWLLGNEEEDKRKDAEAQAQAKKREVRKGE